MLARAWRVSPAELRECTLLEIETMWAVIRMESEMRKRHG